MRRQFKVRQQFVAGGLQKHRSNTFGRWLFANLRLTSLLPLLFLLPVLLSASGEVRANDTVAKAESANEIRGTAETRQEDGFARIIFKFNHLPKHSYALEDGILVLRFEEPVKVNVSRVAERLNRYVGIARLDPDGRSIRFALTQSYRTNLMAAGELLFLDIMPSNWVGLPPPLPDHVVAELADRVRKSDTETRKRALQRREAQGDIKFNIRVSRFPTFSRITFEWNQFTTVDFSRRKKNVIVAFDALTDIDLGLLKTDPPRYVQGAKAESGPDGIKISMQISPEADVRGFREGNNFIVDLTGPDSDIEIATKSLRDELDREKGLKSAAGKPQPGTKLDGETPRKKNRTEVDADIVKEAFLSTTRPFKFHNLDPVNFGDWSIELPDNSNDTAKQPTTDAQEKAELAPVNSREATKGAGEDSSRPEPKSTKPVIQQQANDIADSGNIRSVKAEMTKIGNAIKLKFPFATETSAAVFRRGRIVWLVFDSPDFIDFSGIADRADSVVDNIQQNQLGRRSIVRLQLQQPWLTHTSKMETTWVVQIGNMVTGEASTLNLQRSLRGDKKSIVTVKLPGAGRVHWIDDPQIGDRFGVVTAFSPVRNISKPQDFVEFSVLPSTHGLVVRPKTDDLAVRLIVDEVLITRNQGLALSPGTAHQYVAGRKALDKKNNSRAGFLDFSNWQKGGVKSFQNSQSRLEKEIAAAKPKDRNALRLQLARLYMAHMLVPETLGVIRQIISEDQGAESDPAINILRGAANVSMGYLAEADKDLNVHALAHDPDAALWRGLLQANQQNWSDAVKNFQEGQPVVGEYPSEIQGQFQLANAKSAIELRKLAIAADVLDSLSKVKLGDRQFGQNQLLRGRYLDAIGRNEEAIEAYKEAIKSDIAPVAAEAEYRLVNLLVRNNKISQAEALKRLERLSIVWRGDETELRTLRLLANLYVR
ncbi:MAG: tetratricopeptide repeat protein, partial [Methyloligellaceae bacterium]